MALPGIAPTQTGWALLQARSPTRIVLLAPSLMSVIRILLLQKKMPLPVMPSASESSSPPQHAA
jgi:hypothetical protein